MDVVILAGGRGTRALPFTAERPKAMLPLAGRPLLEHVLRIYAEQGFTRFVLAVGYRADAIEEHFADSPWEIRFSRAPVEADTGTRLRHAAGLVEGAFFAAYTDGLADIDLHALAARHRAAGGAATLTTAPLRAPFGTVDVDGGGVVRAFTEKPTIPDIRVSAGFFVFEPQALAARGESLEREMLPALAATGRLAAYEHRGFWRSVDTFKDAEELEAMLAAGRARWAGSRAAASS